MMLSVWERTPWCVWGGGGATLCTVGSYQHLWSLTLEVSPHSSDVITENGPKLFNNNNKTNKSLPRCLRMFPALMEDPSLFPRTQVGRVTTICNSRGNLMPSSGLKDTCTHMYTSLIHTNEIQVTLRKSKSEKHPFTLLHLFTTTVLGDSSPFVPS